LRHGNYEQFFNFLENPTISLFVIGDLEDGSTKQDSNQKNDGAWIRSMTLKDPIEKIRKEIQKYNIIPEKDMRNVFLVEILMKFLADRDQISVWNGEMQKRPLEIIDDFSIDQDKKEIMRKANAIRNKVKNDGRIEENDSSIINSTIEILIEIAKS
jgi:hypothetical protein